MMGKKDMPAADYRALFFFFSPSQFFMAGLFWIVVVAFGGWCVLCGTIGKSSPWVAVVAAPITLGAALLAIRCLCNAVRLWLASVRMFYSRWS